MTPTGLLFVYGSLKRAQSNHGVLGGARFRGLVRTAPSYALRTIDGYPALVPGDRCIVGELYEVADFAALDDFEGEGYVRREIELVNAERAQAYLAAVPDAGAPFAGDEWPM